MTVVDMTMQKIGRLLVLGRSEDVQCDGEAWWECLCDCGTLVDVRGSSLRRDKATTSCGCYQREVLVGRTTTHGARKRNLPYDDLYQTWVNIKQRCYNKSHISYRRYGGRGIGMSAEFLSSFESFAAHVGPRPSKKHQLDRINNDKGYERGNVRWATTKRNARNRSTTTFVSYRGLKLSLPDWADMCGLTQAALRGRLENGWSVERALAKWSPWGEAFAVN